MITLIGSHRPCLSLANLPGPPLVTLRKRVNSVSSTHSGTQKRNTVRTIQYYLNQTRQHDADCTNAKDGGANPEKTEEEKGTSGTSTVSFQVALGFFAPSLVKKVSDLHGCFVEMKRLEDRLLARDKWRRRPQQQQQQSLLTNDADERTRAWVRSDCTKRLGELAVCAMKLDSASEVSKKMWSEWLQRAPKDLLGALFTS
mmetsp:Transcript_22317/g.41907  ORF Transcript_22317/g.41907 Transcript_22317/m.41907 type:complete len:200 (-) Transcript_22317:82-681(-)